jgi:hypothetical protein
LTLPGVIITEPGVIINDAASLPVLEMEKDEIPSDNNMFLNLLYELKEEWYEPVNPHYVFFATDLDNQNRSRNLRFKKTVQKITAMDCILGEDMRENPNQSTTINTKDSIQTLITEKIKNAFVVIADLTKNQNSDPVAFNLNTCIEAGIARSAKNANLYLISKGPRRSPPFMFRDREVFFYENDRDFFKMAEHLLLPYRRRIINLELQ